MMEYFKMWSDVQDLTRATKESACYDLRAYFGEFSRIFTVYKSNNVQTASMAYQIKPSDPFFTVLEPGDRALIPTGIILNLEPGTSARIHIRSSAAIKRGLTLPNCEGIIDSDYVEQVVIPIMNISTEKVRIEHGERIAQIEIVEMPRVRDLTITNIKPTQKTDRVGGYGSTGVK